MADEDDQHYMKATREKEKSRRQRGDQARDVDQPQFLHMFDYLVALLVLHSISGRRVTAPKSRCVGQNSIH